MDRAEFLVSGVSALLFASVFLFGRRLHPFRSIIDHRSIISFSAGLASAYVFVRVLPELAGARHVFRSALPAELPREGAGIYFVALLGFLTFYGLDQLHAHLRVTARFAASPWRGFAIHVGGFGAYVSLVTYLLVNGLEGLPRDQELYAGAMAVHFLTVDHSLLEEHGAAYERIGRFVLAAMAIAGWVVGLAVKLPVAIAAVLVAFVSGAVIVNGAIMELPREKEGRFIPFLLGGIIYGAILLMLA